MKKLVLFLLLWISALLFLGASAEAQKILLMASDQDTVTRAFYRAKACQGLIGVELGSHLPFDYSIAVAGNGGNFEVLLLDKRSDENTPYVFLGQNYWKGTERACQIIKGRRQTAWRLMGK